MGRVARSAGRGFKKIPLCRLAATSPPKGETFGAYTLRLNCFCAVPYYFAAWNALALVFHDAEIAPYKVHLVGRADGISELLEKAGGALRVTLEE